jgi:hypothetical protein
MPPEVFENVNTTENRFSLSQGDIELVENELKKMDIDVADFLADDFNIEFNFIDINNYYLDPTENLRHKLRIINAYINRFMMRQMGLKVGRPIKINTAKSAEPSADVIELFPQDQKEQKAAQVQAI